MPLGIQNVTTVTQNNITNIANSTSYPEFAIKVTHQIYDGWLFFVILLIVGYALYQKIQDRIDQPLNNIMYISLFLTFVALFLRAVRIPWGSDYIGLISDKQFWVFPVIFILCAGIIWATKDKWQI